LGSSKKFSSSSRISSAQHHASQRLDADVASAKSKKSKGKKSKCESDDHAAQRAEKKAKKLK
jgi:hypothetical protein